MRLEFGTSPLIIAVLVHSIVIISGQPVFSLFAFPFIRDEKDRGMFSACLCFALYDDADVLNADM
jgi:hypothetical protein